jgi:signal transduction histidine kinase
MKSLLAVPIHCQGPNRGSLYVCDRSDSTPFSEADADTLTRFANQAAVAIDNAYLHERIRELAAAEERQRIAHEMHDGLAQILAYVNTKAQAVTEYLKNNQADRAREHLDQLAKASRQVYADVRGHILDLRTSAAAGELNEALRDYAQKWSDQCGVDVILAMEDRLWLEPELELQVLRILQESLTNVRKHASASQVEIVLQRRDRHLYGRVEDDGQGFNPLELIPASSPRFGLATMRERAAAAGGTLKIDAASGRGTRVVFDLPLTPAR